MNFPDYSKFVSRGFASKEEAMKDKRVTDMVCYKCRRMLRKKDPLVFLWTEILPLSGRVPGAWAYEGEDPDEKG